MVAFALAVALFLSLLTIPAGLPGTWLMIGAGLLYSYLVPSSGIGTFTILGCLALAMIAEVLDIAVAGRYTRKYGGSARGAWGAILGGFVGMGLGLPVPVVGSVLGAFAGSFIGALVAEYSRGARHDEAARAATGATIGRAIAMGLKAATGCVIAAWLMASVILR